MIISNRCLNIAWKFVGNEANSLGIDVAFLFRLSEKTVAVDFFYSGAVYAVPVQEILWNLNIFYILDF